MKVYLHFEGTPDFTLKTNVDDGQTISNICESFINAYNEKHSTAKYLKESYVELYTSSRKQLKPEDLVHKAIKDGDDIYVVEKPNLTKTCTRNGCGQTYKDSDNTENVCSFHSGAPVFHEGLKGWSCCSKRVLTFDEFMTIPGCALGTHTDVETRPKESKPIVPSMKDVKLVSNEANVEVYKSNNNNLPQVTPPKPAPKIETPPVEEIEEPDPVDAVIPMGASCTHRGCNATYSGPESRTEECVYHIGVPVFHEGSKGWSCCSRKVLEFEEFMKIVGCKNGRHKFIPKKQESAEIQCRYDWYQMANNVVVAIYGKSAEKEKSNVQINKDSISLKIQFPDGKVFRKEMKLSGVVNPEQSKVTFLGTKVELSLRKADGSQWSKLEQ